MPELRLDVAWLAVLLEMRRACSTKGLVCHIGDARILRQRLEVTFQIIPKPERCAVLRREEQIGGGCRGRDMVWTLLPSRLNPHVELFFQSLADADVRATPGCFRLTDAPVAALDLLHGFINSELPGFDIVLAQREKLARPQTAVDEDTEHQVFATVGLRKQPPDFLKRVVTLARFSQKL